MAIVVVGVDGSAASDEALRCAHEEARLRGALLRVVLAWSYLDQPGGRDFDPHFSEDDARAVLDDIIRRVIGTTDVKVVHRVVCDRPGPALVSESDDADVVVVGTHGKGWIRGIVLGSVSQYVLHNASCPVIVVPSPRRAD